MLGDAALDPEIAIPRLPPEEHIRAPAAWSKLLAEAGETAIRNHCCRGYLVQATGDNATLSGRNGGSGKAPLVGAVFLKSVCTS